MFIMSMLSRRNLLHLRWLCRVAPCLWCRLILETDPGTIASRVAMRGADTENLPLSEQVGTASCCAPLLLDEIAAGSTCCLFHESVPVLSVVGR